MVPRTLHTRDYIKALTENKGLTGRLKAKTLDASAKEKPFSGALARNLGLQEKRKFGSTIHGKLLSCDLY